MLNQKDELEKYTQSELKKMVQKELPGNSLELINGTLEYLAKEALKQQKIAQNRIDSGVLQPTLPTTRQIALLQSHAVTLLDLKDLVKDAIKLYTTKSILRQLTETFTVGWATNTMVVAWKEATNHHLPQNQQHVLLLPNSHVNNPQNKHPDHQNQHQL